MNIPFFNKATDSYPNIGLSKTDLQIKSLISLVNHKGPIVISGNKFETNSGTKGIIYIDVASQGYPIVIASNSFDRNAGYIDANVIFVRLRVPNLDT